MLFSLALIFLLGITLGSLFQKLRLPALLGMLLTGILLGPYMWDLLDPKILGMSSELRKIALIIILSRAGLSLKLRDLLKVGRPTLFLSFLPATCELIAVFFLGQWLFGLTPIESIVLGSVLAAVSPAVIVPKMIQLMERKIGTNKNIPQMIMVASSMDDVFVIVIFSAFTALAAGKAVSASQFVSVPISIVLGMLAGIVSGWIFAKFFQLVHIRDTGKVVILLSVSFLFVTLEKIATGTIGFSGLLAVMAAGASLQYFAAERADRLSAKFSKLWFGAEVLLFVLVGATVDLSYAMAEGSMAVLLIAGALVLRMLGVFLCMLGTNLNLKERFFCMIAYMPKATVQAAIGSVPLAMGLACGNTVLTIAVVSIIVTAPLGALFIDLTQKSLLTQEIE